MKLERAIRHRATHANAQSRRTDYRALKSARLLASDRKIRKQQRRHGRFTGNVRTFHQSADLERDRRALSPDRTGNARAEFTGAL